MKSCSNQICVKQIIIYFIFEILQSSHLDDSFAHSWHPPSVVLIYHPSKDQQVCYFKAIKEAHCTFYSAMIDNNRGNPRTWFSIIRYLLHPPDSGHPTATTEQRYINSAKKKHPLTVNCVYFQQT